MPKFYSTNETDSCNRTNKRGHRWARSVVRSYAGSASLMLTTGDNGAADYRLEIRVAPGSDDVPGHLILAAPLADIIGAESLVIIPKFSGG
jgi:hypothetical protein